jgi:hypothetical protein
VVRTRITSGGGGEADGVGDPRKRSWSSAGGLPSKKSHIPRRTSLWRRPAFSAPRNGRRNRTRRPDQVIRNLAYTSTSRRG